MALTRILADGYGGKRAYVAYLRSRFANALGAYSPWSRPPPETTSRLVFVCKGNICRSAFAAAYARARGLSSTSAGLAATTGVPANGAALATARSHGIRLDDHRALALSELPLDREDLILVFEPDHAEEVAARSPHLAESIRLIGAYATPCTPYIHDPYGLSEQYFEACFSRIESAIDGLSVLIARRPSGASSSG